MKRVRQLVLLLLNVVATVFTLIMGLRENPIVVYFTSKYTYVRSRFLLGQINYNIVRDDLFNASALVDLAEVGQSFRFITAPQRNPQNLGEDRSTCMRVNTMNVSILTLNYDDIFGYRARRQQTFLYSISAPHCDVINVKPAWLDTCVNTTFGGNATACHEFILNNFTDLQANRLIQAGIPEDFGTPGQPFLKCVGRAEERFKFLTDLMVHQSLWAGGAFHVELQTSRCWAEPVLRDAGWKYGLFQVEAADQAADVVVAVEQENWFVYLVSIIYGTVSIYKIFRGLFITIELRNVEYYMPAYARTKLFGYIPIPFMQLVTHYLCQDKRQLVTCRGRGLRASDLWMNHWLYILVSVLEALTSVRMTYCVLEMGTWMLWKIATTDNFIFVCCAITKITWIMCLVHSVFRYACKLCLYILRRQSIAMIAHAVDVAEWYVDSITLFVSFKMYALLLCTQLVRLGPQ
ncbi:TPA: hypothetical protein N0F65_003227 [Lagenidium giganteum]|uniref:Uncharacterized protein n=1 Tax=Lagenidium giganteum TaxID=4803 RepID=A0AAV2ZAI3_9STRA|nr:TPA: hypothetical protein N0F65_003227 [Lagenidium giganteum]